jgi:hypothetical protein
VSGLEVIADKVVDLLFAGSGAPMAIGCRRKAW